MTLQDDLESKRPGEWTQEDIRGLQRKYSRTHYTHFSPSPVKLKRAPRKRIGGVVYIRLFGQWIPEPRNAKTGAEQAPEVRREKNKR